MRVTIGIPFYNSESTLPEAIRSVFAQTYTDWELILLDDGSTDRSLEIAKAVDDARVSVHSDKQNRGLSSRLNQIADLARGQYIARMDADDLMHPERLAMQVAYLDSHPDCDLVGSAEYSIDGNNKVIGVNSGPAELNALAVLSKGAIWHPTIAAKAEWCRKNRYDDSFWRAEDRELWCRTYACSSFARIKQPLYFYREGARNPFRYLKDYGQSNKTERRIFKIYGPSMVGYSHTCRLIIMSYIKCGLYLLATMAGKQKALTARRNVPLTASEYIAASDVLAEILAVSVPGLSSRDVVPQPLP